VNWHPRGRDVGPAWKKPLSLGVSRSVVHRSRRERQAPGPRGKTRSTFHVPAALVDEARSAVVALAGPPLRLTLAAFVENAFRHELERLLKKPGLDSEVVAVYSDYFHRVG
jgi:hypothetical protein